MSLRAATALVRRPALAAVGLGLALGLLGAPGGASAGPQPFPPDVGKANPMRAPGLLSGPVRPLGTGAHTGYHAFLTLPVHSTTQPLFLGLLEFYRVVVSPVNGSDANLAPVPSLYAVQAIKTHGVLLGSVLTTARLIDEPSVIPHAPSFTEDGREFFYDPMAWNVYWLPAWLRDP